MIVKLIIILIKAMHDKFPKYLDKDHVNMELFEYLNRWNTLDSKERLKDSSQQHRTRHKHYIHLHKYIIKQDTADQCRMCQSQPETVEHMITVCQVLATNQYFTRHIQLATQLHKDICKHYNIKVEAQHWLYTGTITSLNGYYKMN